MGLLPHRAAAVTEKSHRLSLSSQAFADLTGGEVSGYDYDAIIMTRK
jgi:hypothetical protein